MPAVNSDKSWSRIAKLLQKLQDAVVYLFKDAIHLPTHSV